MNVADRAYLHLRANLLENYQREATARGEEFHVADNFALLSDGLTLAQAQWQHDETSRKLVLRLRQPLASYDEPKLDTYAAYFYDRAPFDAYPSVTVTSKGLIERAYACSEPKAS